MYLLLHDMIYINCMHDMISIYIACIICYYAITQYMSFFLIRVPEKNCYTKIKKTTFLKKMYNFGLIRLSWYVLMMSFISSAYRWSYIRLREAGFEE